MADSKEREHPAHMAESMQTPAHAHFPCAAVCDVSPHICDFCSEYDAYPNPLTAACEPCQVDRCLTCSTDSSKCEVCESGFRLDSGACTPVSFRRNVALQWPPRPGLLYRNADLPATPLGLQCDMEGCIQCHVPTGKKCYGCLEGYTPVMLDRYAVVCELVAEAFAPVAAP